MKFETGSYPEPVLKKVKPPKLKSYGPRKSSLNDILGCIKNTFFKQKSAAAAFGNIYATYLLQHLVALLLTNTQTDTRTGEQKERK